MTVSAYIAHNRNDGLMNIAAFRVLYGQGRYRQDQGVKIVSFEMSSIAGRMQRLGALLDGDEHGRVLDLTAAYEKFLVAETDEPTPRGLAYLRCPPDMIGWLQAGAEGRKAADAAIGFVRRTGAQLGANGEQLAFAREQVVLLAPVPRPRSMRCFSIYDEHMSKTDSAPMLNGAAALVKLDAWYRTPAYYKGACDSVRGPESPVPYPYYTKRLDLEIEIGIVIGKQGRNLTPAEARDHIAGYTIVVDSSARDGYEREPFGPTKRKDFHTAMGPCLVTADAVDPENLRCSITVDGERWFEGSTSAPHTFTPAQLVAFASDNETIFPGDVILSGTIGLGCSMDIHKWVSVGQTATFEIETLGAMALRIVPGEQVVSHVSGMQGLMNPDPTATTQSGS